MFRYLTKKVKQNFFFHAYVPYMHVIHTIIKILRQIDDANKTKHFKYFFFQGGGLLGDTFSSISYDTFNLICNYTLVPFRKFRIIKQFNEALIFSVY